MQPQTTKHEPTNQKQYPKILKDKRPLYIKRMTDSDTESENEFKQVINNCYICRFKANNLGRLMPFLPENVCLNICKMNSCKKCDLFYKMNDIGNEIDKLEEERRITKGSGNKRLIRKEEKGCKINKELEEITEKTIHIYNKYF